MSGHVSHELLIIADRIEATAQRLRALAKSDQHERHKAMIGIDYIVQIPVKAELDNLASAACYEELARVKDKK